MASLKANSASAAEQIINWDKFFLPYKQAVNELTVKLKSLADGFVYLSETSPIEQVSGRVKTVTSILEKARRKGVSVYEAEAEIEDIAGIRIICRFVDDIARVAKMIRDRHGLDIEVIKERDYVTNMKPSGYRSYHMIVRYPVITALGNKTVTCEIQIRTLAMNFWAVVEHSLKYKYRGNLPAELKMRLIRSAEAAFRLDNEISEIRDDIIEAEHSEMSRDKTIEDIVRKIQALYKVAETEEVENLNRAFYNLYEHGSMEELADFDKMVAQIADYYKVW